MKVRVAEYNENVPCLRVAHLDFYLERNGDYICNPFTKGEVEFANQIAFEISNGRKELRNEIDDLQRRLINLTGAVEDFLNDVREKPAVEKLERAMNDYGMRE
jgi:hypothetical protein